MKRPFARAADPVLDLAFIEEHTTASKRSRDDLAARRGTTFCAYPACRATQIERVARIYMQAKSVIVCYGMGITQHRCGARERAADRQSAHAARQFRQARAPAFVRCAAIRMCRATARSASTRSREPELLAQIEKVFGFPPPQQHGQAVVDTVQAMIDGRSEVFVGLGGNFVAAVPDTEIVKDAMRRLKLTVAINTKLNRGHIVHGEEALILPCLARSDIDIQATGRQSITVEDSMSMVHASGGLVTPPSAASEIRSGDRLRHGARDVARQRDRLGRIRGQLRPDSRQDRGGVPETVRGLQRPHSPARRISSLQWPRKTGNGTRRPDAPISWFARASRKILRFKIPRRCSSQRSAATTIQHDDLHPRRPLPRRLRRPMVVFMNKDDMADRNIQPDSLVELESVTGGGDVRRAASGFKVRPYDIPRGSIAAYYPETNCLLPLSHHDKKSKTPSAKSIPVLVRAMASQGAA